MSEKAYGHLDNRFVKTTCFHVTSNIVEAVKVDWCFILSLMSCKIEFIFSYTLISRVEGELSYLDIFNSAQYPFGIVCFIPNNV